MVKISIVTCTYNAVATLARTLESVGCQDYRAVEHIIVDGASSDGTLQMVGAYAKASDAREGHSVVAMSEKDDGLYFAMNKGIAKATGDYILFLNAGDTLTDNHTLSAVAAVAEGSDVLPGVVYGDTDIVDEEGRFVRHRRLHPGEALSWRDFRYGMLVCHQAFYALTSIAKNIPYDTRYRYSADIDWCIRVMRQAEQEGRGVVSVGRVVANYLCEGMTTAHHGASLRERFDVMRRHYGMWQTMISHAWFVVRAVIRR